MISPELPSLSANPIRNPTRTQLILPMGPPDMLCSNHVEFDFCDIFGAIQDSEGLNLENSRNLVSEIDSKESLYDDPPVIYSRSHSFLGPSAYVTQTAKLTLTLQETEDSLELIEVENVDTRADNCKPANCNFNQKVPNVQVDDNPLDSTGVGLEDFEVLRVVGQGAFGKVYQVRRRGTSDIYAMKVMRKDVIMEKNQVEYMKSERDILTKVDYPFIVQLRYSFQTKYRLYLVLDFVNGGHLFFQLYRQGLFREDLARIYTAEIVSAVSHLHSKGIMHRDLKPENILLDAEGHVVLTDFGLAKEFDEHTRSNSMCGTLEYMAPEIIIGKGHDKAADWWSVGILLFEMLTGMPPFTGKNKQIIQEKIVKGKMKLPAFLSSEAHSLLKGLLQKEASRRLGSGPAGSKEIKSHKWFKSINWKKLEARQLKPSFIPEVKGKDCYANFEKRWTNMPVLDSPAASPKGGEDLFKGFSFVRPATALLSRNS